MTYVVVTVVEADGSLVYLNGEPVHAEIVPEMQTETAVSDRGGEGKSAVFYVVIANFMLQN